MVFEAVETSPAKRKRRSSAKTREHVLDAAFELFYWDGIHATGVDRVAKEAGVSPTTLYRLFDSKDDLVYAYVERNSAGYKELLAEASVASAGTPRERILAMFDAIAEQIQPEHCRGCPFQMTLAEYPDDAASAHASAVETKAWVRSRLRELAGELGVGERAAVLGDQLALLVEGIYASVQALGVEGPVAQARGAAEVLIDASVTAASPIAAAGS